MITPTVLAEDPFVLAPPDEVAERHALTRALEMSRGAFTLLFAIGNQADRRDRLMANVVAQRPTLRIQIIPLREPVRNLLVELRHLLESPPPDAIFIHGIEGWLTAGVEAEDDPFILNLNVTRNHFPEELPIPLVFWVPQHVLITLARGAPDFCSVRSGIYSFCATPEGRERMVKSLVSFDQSAMAGLALDEKLERAASLATMLGEFEALSDDLRDPLVEARLMNSLAQLREILGDYHAAEQLFRRALVIRETSLGPNDSGTGQSLNNLASLYNSQQRYAEAEPLLRRALAIRETSLGPNHPNTATTMNNLAFLYGSQGRFAEAEPLYRRALEAMRTSVGPNHPNTVASMNNLALLYSSQGRYAEAEPLYRNLLAISESTLGNEHPSIAAGLNNLARLYQRQGRYAEAEPLLRRALPIAEASLGPDHPYTALVLENYSKLLAQLGREDEAASLRDRARAAREAHARRNASVPHEATPE